MLVATGFRSVDAFAIVLYSRSTIGIMAVGLLMIGNEFDLSAGAAATMLYCNFWVGALLALGAIPCRAQSN